jgi:4-hydroxybenzoate polyprenyltransferase
MHPVVKSLRLRQWTKNMVLFAGLAFSGQALEQEALLHAGMAFLAFCLGSSSVYLFNDILDRDRDRAHPVKRLRPIASGALKVGAAIAIAIGLAAVAVILSLPLGNALWALLAYWVLQAFYTPWLKHVVLLDVFCIAAGFSLRVLAGVWAIDAPLSPWLVACTVQLALFMALCKRRAEAASLDLSAGDDIAQRPTLGDYASPATDMMIGVAAASTLVTYTLYTLLPAQVVNAGIPGLDSRAGEPGMVFTLPFVYFGVMRYLLLVYGRGRGERPERIATMDPPTILAALGFAAVAGAVVYL